MKAFKANNAEVVLFSYSIGFCYIFCGEVLTGTFMPAFTYCNEHPQIYWLSFLFSLVGYVGILFVLSMVKSYGALLAVTVTTFRKALSIITSFLFFTKPFTMQYVWSGAIVFSGIALNIYRSAVANELDLTFLVKTETELEMAFFLRGAHYAVHSSPFRNGSDQSVNRRGA